MLVGHETGFPISQIIGPSEVARVCKAVSAGDTWDTAALDNSWAIRIKETPPSRECLITILTLRGMLDEHELLISLEERQEATRVVDQWLNQWKVK